MMSLVKNLLAIVMALSSGSLEFIIHEARLLEIFNKLHEQVISEWYHKLTRLEAHLKSAFHHMMCILMLNVIAPLLHLSIISIFLLVASLFTSYFYIAFIYAAWYIIDYDTCETSSRSLEWFRNIFGYVYDYFDFSVVYEGPELDINANYVAGYHPHGIFPIGSALAFGTNPPNLPFNRQFKRCHVAHSFLFRIPIFREILQSLGTRAASERAIDNILKNSGNGNIMAIAPGGLAEMMYCSKGKLYLKLKKRYGFVRKAIETGSHLLPCLGFGETEILHHKVFPKGHIVDIFQTFCRRVFNFNLPFAYGNWFGLPGFTPNKVKLTLCIGSPIKVVQNPNPSLDEIERIHNIYITELEAIFNKYRQRYAELDYDFEIR